MPQKSRSTRSSNSSHTSPMKGSPHPQRRDKHRMSDDVETASESDGNENDDDNDPMNSTAYSSAMDTASSNFDTMDSFNTSGISAFDSPRRTRRNVSPASAEKRSPRQQLDDRNVRADRRTQRDSEHPRRDMQGKCTSGVIKRQVDDMNKAVIVLVLLALLFSAYFLGLWFTDTESPVYRDQFEIRFDEFNSDLSVLKSEFLSQDINMWRTLHAATRQVLLNDEPAYPAVILLASLPSSESTSACLTQKILKAFTDRVSGEPSAEVVDVTQFQNALPDEQKLRLDEYLNKIFDSKKVRAASIANLNKLHPEAGMLLHSFADNENANFKNVLLILQFHVPRAEYLQSGQKVEDYLQATWAKVLGMDKIGGLMSRIANNIAIVTAETATISDC